jgi:hypothetical protein
MREYLGQKPRTLHIKPFNTITTSHSHQAIQNNCHTSFTMKANALLCTLIAVAAVTASTVPELQVRDTCGAGYGGDQRRTNSPCEASNGDRHFCGCDRTGVVC